MKKKLISIVMTLIMLITLLGLQFDSFAAISGIKVQFNNGNTAASSNTLNAKFKITNTGSSTVKLSDLKLRYFYTIDSEKAQTYYNDYSSMINGGSYSDITKKVTGTLVKMQKPIATADYYLEVGFASDAGSLAVGGTIDVQARVAKSDWSNYDQSNDYSYKLAGSYIDSELVTAYIDGSLVFGKEPVPTPTNPTITPAAETFKQGKATDINVAIVPNGNTFIDIKGLTKDTDYTVSGNNIKILKSYLNTLAEGQKELTFDFGVVNNPILTLSVISPIEAPTLSAATATFDKYAPEDISITLTPNGNTFKGIKGLVSGTDYTVSGDSVKISQNYLSTLDIGTKELTFDFGVKINPVLAVKVKDSTPTGLIAKIGTTAGAKGDTVTLPVTLTSVSKAGNVGTFNCYINYDATLLEAVSVGAGDIVINPNINLSYRIDKGTISFLFLDETIGSELISKDGVLANITFKVLGSSSITTPVTFKNAVFGDGNFSRLPDVTLISGSVKLN